MQGIIGRNRAAASMVMGASLVLASCGGNDDGAKGVLAALRRGHAPATFFLTGHFVQSYPVLARAIGRRYPVGNHTVNHLDMLRLSPAAAMREITRAAVMIQRATGRDTRKPWFPRKGLMTSGFAAN